MTSDPSREHILGSEAYSLGESYGPKLQRPAPYYSNRTLLFLIHTNSFAQPFNINRIYALLAKSMPFWMLPLSSSMHLSMHFCSYSDTCNGAVAFYVTTYSL